jgi:hypothetical protein
VHSEVHLPVEILMGALHLRSQCLIHSENYADAERDIRYAQHLVDELFRPLIARGGHPLSLLLYENWFRCISHRGNTEHELLFVSQSFLCILDKFPLPPITPETAVELWGTQSPLCIEFLLKEKIITTSPIVITSESIDSTQWQQYNTELQCYLHFQQFSGITLTLKSTMNRFQTQMKDEVPLEAAADGLYDDFINWGRNINRECLHDTKSFRINSEQNALKKVKQVVCGIQRTACLLEDGQVYIWGAMQAVPAPLAFPTSITQIALKDYQLVALDTNGAVFLWTPQVFLLIFV